MYSKVKDIIKKIGEWLKEGFEKMSEKNPEDTLEKKPEMTPERKPGEMSGKNTGRRVLKVVIIVFAALILTTALGLGVAYAIISARLSAGSVPTVEADDENTIVELYERPPVVTPPPLPVDEPDDPNVWDRWEDELEFDFVHEGDDYIFERDEISARIFNVLILGDDARQHEARGRADAIMLASFHRDTQQIQFTSFMRDMFVPMTLAGDRWFRINHIHAEGGPGRMINFMNNIFSLDIQYYVVLRFDSIFVLVDILGGLELELTAAEAAAINNVFTRYEPVSEGVNLLNGRQVLFFSRLRVIDSDFARTARQRYVMTAVLDRVLTTRSFREIASLANFALNHVETNIPLSTIISLAHELFMGDPPTISELRIPVDGGFERVVYRGANVLDIDFRMNIAAVHRFIFGTTAGARFPIFQSRAEVYDFEEDEEEIEAELIEDENGDVEDDLPEDFPELDDGLGEIEERLENPIEPQGDDDD